MTRLFVYGSLRPGEPNHHLLADLAGRWTRAFVRGRLRRAGWGAEMGYPALIPDDGAGRVAGYLLESDELQRRWEQLDAFEGDEYRRVTVDVEPEEGSRVEAFVYVLGVKSLPCTGAGAPESTPLRLECGAVPIEAGQSLLHYRIVDKLGEGGMGVVWKAVDTTLDREVAIKVLPQDFAADADRAARFAREAKLVASLNHPNIASVFSVHQAGGSRFLAMELVPGEDLSETIARGALPIAEALEIAMQIAEALAAAHARGIVHRDLKPANVKRTPDGTIKVLDFGLAKGLVGEPAAERSDPALSPTMTSVGSVVGMILGTAGYMSPEQARGKPVDARADLWALGVILFEMLTGRRAFPGEDVSEILAGVIKSDPDWEALPPDLPRSARLVLRRCLERRLDARMHAAADVRILLEEARRELATPQAESVAPRARAAWVPWALLAVALVLWAATRWIGDDGGPGAQPGMIRFHLDPPAGSRYVPTLAPFFDIMPDGRTIVFSAVGEDGWLRLYSRELASLEAAPIAGTEGAQGPFVSPDGSIGFNARSKLWITRLDGLAPREITEVADAFSGGTWLADGSIAYSDDFDSGLLRVSADGGPPEPLSVPDRDAGETRHEMPHALPGGRGVVFTLVRPGTATSSRGRGEAAVLDLDSGEVSTFDADATGPYHYLPSGHLVMRQAGRLITRRFDERTLQATGPAVPVFEPAGEGDEPVVTFAVSPQGTLVHSNATLWTDKAMVWVDRDGGESPIAEAGSFIYPVVSPDGRRVAVTDSDQLWLYDETGRRVRLTQEGISLLPLWLQDGERIVFASYQPDENLYWMTTDGSGAMELLLDADHRQYPLDWHEQSQSLILQWADPQSGYDIWTLSMSGEPVAKPFLNSPHNERWAQVSPDGRWIAYASNETGREEVYVCTFPGCRAKRAVTTDGGIEPRWSARGDELFFKADSKGELYGTRTELWVVSVSGGSDLVFGTPQLLFTGDYASKWCCGHSYDVAPDARRFVMIKEEPESGRKLSVALGAFD